MAVCLSTASIFAWTRGLLHRAKLDGKIQMFLFLFFVVVVVVFFYIIITRKQSEKNTAEPVEDAMVIMQDN